MLQGQTKEFARDFFQFLVSVDSKDHGEEYIRRVATAFIVTPFHSCGVLVHVVRITLDQRNDVEDEFDLMGVEYERLKTGDVSGFACVAPVTPLCAQIPWAFRPAF